MSIATAIQNAQQKVADAYTAISNKGGTLPATQNLSNMPTAISSIPSGGGSDNLPAFLSTGVSSISDSTITSIRPYAFQNNNSTYVTNPISSISCSNVTSVGEYAFHSASSLQTASFPSLTTLGGYAFYGCNSLTGFTIPSTLNTIKTYTFYNCKGFISLTIPSNVTSIEGSAFSGCTNMEELNYNATNATFTSGQNSVFNNMGKDKNNLVFNIGNNVEVIPVYFLYSSSSTSSLPNIKTINISSNNSIKKIGQYAFYRCTALTSVSFPSITSVTESSQYAFQNCSNLTSVSFPNLQSITIDNGFYNIFAGCSSLTTIDLSSLSSIATKQALRRAFYNCTSLQSVSFPALTSSSFDSYTNQFNTMLSGVTGCTVHFPSNLQSVIGSWSDVTAGFGGTNTTVLFDLPATN